MTIKNPNSVWEYIKKIIFDDYTKKKLLDFLKGQAITLALKKILGSAAMGGFKGWLVKLLVEEIVIEKIGEPIMHYALHEAEYQVDVLQGKIIVKQMNKARDNGDQKEYDSATDDIFR